MVRPAGFEPVAYRVGVCHSIQLSYGRIFNCTAAVKTAHRVWLNCSIAEISAFVKQNFSHCRKNTDGPFGEPRENKKMHENFDPFLWEM